MKKLILVVLIAFNGSIAVADYDAALEAREDAQRRARAAEQEKREAEVNAQVAAAREKTYHELLGAEGNGLSGAELERAYNAKVARQQQAALQNQKDAMRMYQEGQKQAAAHKDENDALMKGTYGKSLTELQNMSDKDLEKFAADMEKKFGAQAGQ